MGIEIQADTGGTGFSCSNNLIGGTTSAEGNVISGNTTAGIQLADDVIATTIEGNLIGVNAADTSALPNGAGIQLLGSTDAGTPVTGTIINDNVISGNTAEGISLASSTVNSTIQANFIGTNSSGASLGNGGSGIIIEGTDGFPCTGNLIGGTSSASDGNTIEFNGAYGVEVDGNATTPDILNPILGNSIFLNANNGIELLGGGNNDQEPPTINSAAVCAMGGNTVTIGVTAPAAPAASNFRLEFFLNTVNRNPITEGQTFIGAIAPVPSGQTVIQSFTLPDGTVSVGQWVSATATNLNGAGDTPGDTSEFSLNTVFSAFTPPTITSFTADTTSIHAGGSATFTVAFTQGSNPGPFDVMWSDGATQMNVTSPFTRTVSPTSTTTYTVTIIDSVGCTDTSSPITIIVTGPVLPPNSVSGNAIRNIFLTQIDFINIITWTAPTSGAAPVTYKIYRDAALTELIATIPANGPLQYYDHDRQPGVTYSYYIVSIDSLGNVSTPININITS